MTCSQSGSANVTCTHPYPWRVVRAEAVLVTPLSKSEAVRLFESHLDHCRATTDGLILLSLVVSQQESGSSRLKFVFCRSCTSEREFSDARAELETFVGLLTASEYTLSFSTADAKLRRCLEYLREEAHGKIVDKWTVSRLSGEMNKLARRLVPAQDNLEQAVRALGLAIAAAPILTLSILEEQLVKLDDLNLKISGSSAESVMPFRLW